MNVINRKVLVCAIVSTCLGLAAAGLSLIYWMKEGESIIDNLSSLYWVRLVIIGLGFYIVALSKRKILFFVVFIPPFIVEHYLFNYQYAEVSNLWPLVGFIDFFFIMICYGLSDYFALKIDNRKCQNQKGQIKPPPV